MNADTLLKKYTFWHDIHNEFSKNIDFSQTPISELADKSTQEEYKKSRDNQNLHEYIFKFYAYNELLAGYRDKNNGIIDNEDLQIYKEYQDFINDFSKRIFSFILYACSAEARHSYLISRSDENGYEDDYISSLHKAFCKHEFETRDISYTFQNFLEYINDHWEEEDVTKLKAQGNEAQLEKSFYDYVWENYELPSDLPHDFSSSYYEEYYSDEKKLKFALEHFTSQYPEAVKESAKFEDFVKYILEVNKVGSDGDGGSLQRALLREQTIQTSNISHFTTEEVFKFLSAFFKDREHFDSGYGGQPWAEIAEHALSFAKGDINAEMFIDRALSLEHNNGQMFNKNFIFSDSFTTNSYAIIYERGDSLSRHYDNMSITDFILHLQNSSSVLSISQFLGKEFYDLTKNFDVQELKKYHADLNSEHFDYFKMNFNNFKEFAQNIQSVEPMLNIAKKIDYSIPKFDYANMCLVIAQKRANGRSSYNRNYLLESLEEKNNYNSILSDIVNGKYQQIIQEEKVSPYVKKPVFNLHNLNSVSSKSLTRELIGGKAKGLTDLISKGFNVPKAMVFDTQTCLSYLANPKHFQKGYKSVHKQISEYLVDQNNKPLLMSVRSGAPVSMPGMMDSILNVGIDDTTYPALCKIHTKEVVNECAMSFMHQFCASKLGLDIKFPKSLTKALDKFAEILMKNDLPCDRRNLFPLSKEAQVKLSVEAVFDSWNSPRAVAWRNEKNISHDMGTAAIVQQMVFGNRNDKSLTCVIFSRDCITGKPEIMGEYLVKAQGEDLVSGKRTPLPIKELENSSPNVYKEIEYIAKTLEEEKKAIQDLEITVENGKVYVLQMRNAVVSPEAQISLAKELNLNLLDTVHTKNLIGDIKVDTTEAPKFNGLAASPGLISGIVVKNEQDIEKYKNEKLPLIFFSNQALPEHAPIMIATQAFITEFGGSTSHAAILARSMGKPCVVGIGKQEIESGSKITIDAINGKIWEGELPIVVNQESAIELANKIIEEEKIVLDDTIQSNPFRIQSWISELSNFNILENQQNKKHSMFLNLAQKTALALKMETIKKNKII